jgi:hypothetical protein
MTYTVYPEAQETFIDLDIDVFDDDCSSQDKTCTELDFANQEND